MAESLEIRGFQPFSLLINCQRRDYITSTISDLDAVINLMVEPYENTIQLLCTIPGVNRKNAITIISEIGTDMTQFSNSKRLCCWAGLTRVFDTFQ